MRIAIPTDHTVFQSAEVHFFSQIQSSQREKTSQTAQQGYRHLLRQKLMEHFIQNGETNLDPSLLDLEQLPRQQRWAVSLSHSPLGSAFVAFPCHHTYAQVGVDVEATHRLSNSLISRIAKPHEKVACPKPLHLFSAKEAAWKASNKNYKLATISHLETVGWTPLRDDWYTFKVQINDQVLDGQGFSTEIGPICLALYLLN